MRYFRYTKSLLLMCVMLVVLACDEEVLAQTPDHVISEDLVTNSVEKLQSLLTGSYNEITTGNYIGRYLR